jgi:hypothetical protein
MRSLFARNAFSKTTLALAWLAAMPRVAFVPGVIVIVLLASAPATASTVVFDNLGPSDSYGYSGDWFGRIEGAVPENPLAGEFTPSSSGKFNEVWAAIWHQSGLNEVTLALLTDNSGSPSAAIWQQTFFDQLGDDYGCVLHVANIEGPTLTAGTRYWLRASTPDVAGTVQAWYCNDQGDMGSRARWEDGRLWIFSNTERFALRVGVVPEPSTLTNLGVGAISLLAWGWRRRFIAQ